MNPGLILILILALGPTGRAGGQSQRSLLPSIRTLRFPKGPAYIDTFKMELAIDRLHTMTDAIEKINHLRQLQRVPEPPKGKRPSFDKVQDSLDAVRGFLVDEKSSRQADSLSNTLSSVKKLGNLEELMSTMGPIMSMMGNKEDK